MAVNVRTSCVYDMEVYMKEMMVARRAKETPSFKC
jgi:hypothetical protein